MFDFSIMLILVVVLALLFDFSNGWHDSANAIASMAVLMADAHIGLPVSTTHTITSSIMGVGAVRGLSTVKWGVTKRILYACLRTLPGAGVIATLIYLVLS